MQEKEAIIGIYNESGILISKKPRKEVNKNRDILKTTKVLVLNNKNEVFMIKAKDSNWPAEKWGGSCATLVRYNEKIEESAKRALKRELGLYILPEFLEEKYYDWDGVKRILSVFITKTDKDPEINPDDFEEGKWASLQQAKKLIKEGKCMPTFEAAMQILTSKTL